jgi:Na+-translocating ferredoxin:NAD+ oxidoreductase RnfG subunit
MKLKGIFTSLALLAAFLAIPSGAESQVFFTVRALLASHFQSSAHVSYVRVTPTPAQRAHLQERLGQPLAKSSYTFFVARSGDRVDGYALFDEERGQHEQISFGVFFDATGEVSRVEVMAYREPYGDGIRSERFRRQFVGRDARSGFHPGSDIDSISGSTISARSACAVVERATLLLHELVLPEDGRAIARR